MTLWTGVTVPVVSRGGQRFHLSSEISARRICTQKYSSSPDVSRFSFNEVESFLSLDIYLMGFHDIWYTFIYPPKIHNNNLVIS